MKLTEQQIEDLFKDAPEGYNYYTPESEDWFEAWYTVKGDTVIKTMFIVSNLTSSHPFDLEDLLKVGAIKRPGPKEKPKEISMIKFDLEKALAGEKVITRDGQEVTQLVKFDVEGECYQVYGVLNGALENWKCTGDYCGGLGVHHSDLFMAPKMLSGYIGVYRNTSSGEIYSSIVYATKEQIDKARKTIETIAIIDLSKIEEGEGLLGQGGDYGL